MHADPGTPKSWLFPFPHPNAGASSHLQLDLGYRGCHHPGGDLPSTLSVSALPRQCFTIEKLGRRPLIITGFCAMGICSAGITVSLLLQVGSGHRCPPGPLTQLGLGDAGMGITPGEGARMDMRGELALPGNVFPSKLKGRKI